MKVAGKRTWAMLRAVNVAELPIRIDREKIAEFCRARGIRKLSLFGSVLREDFDPTRSDVDVLAEFAPEVRPGLKFFGYGDESWVRERFPVRERTVPSPGGEGEGEGDSPSQ